MTEKKDISALNEIAMDLYDRADKLMEEGGVRSKDAAVILRSQADQFLNQAGEAMEVAYRDATAENRLRRISTEVENLAKEIRFRFDTYRAMKKVGTITAIANDLGCPVETVDHYLCKAFLKHKKRSLRVQMVRSHKFPKRADPSDKKELKRFLLLGVSQPKIRQHFGLSKSAMVAALSSLTEAESLERSLSIQARWRKKHEKVFELRGQGEKLSYIAARTGYSATHVMKILRGEVYCSADLHGATNFHK